MSNIQADSKPAIKSSSSQRVDMKLEVAVLPVSDVDRAKRFYADLGWRIDADFARADGSRAVQLTPPGVAGFDPAWHRTASLSCRVRHRSGARRTHRRRGRCE
jgi:catechol 2,3-dioxygenase-like lactoylglutathione lyase family enzyme